MSDLFFQPPTEYSWHTNYRETFYGEWKCAYEIFNGKNLQEAELIFAEGKFSQMKFAYMPSIPFRYYGVAYVNYLMSNKGKNDTAGLLIFLDILENQLGQGDKNAEDVCFIWIPIMQLFDFIQMNPCCFNTPNIDYHIIEKISHLKKVKNFIDTVRLSNCSRSIK